MLVVLFAVVLLFMIFVYVVSRKGLKLFLLSAAFGLLTLMLCNILSLLPEIDLISVVMSILLSAPGVIVIVFLHLFSFI